MKYTCKVCGWVKETGSYQMTSGDLDDVFKHEKTHGGDKL